MSFRPTGKGAGSGIFVAGIKEAQKGLEEYFEQIFSDIAKKNFQEIGADTVEEMRSDAPVVTGLLRDNIDITSVSAEQLVIEAQADYSGFVEFGTIFQRAQPYFSPAVNSFGKSFLASFGRDANYAWKLIAGKYSSGGFAGLKAI